MKPGILLRSMVPTGLVIIGALVLPLPLLAHCDSMDGPVVQAARAALATNTVELVLVWVQPEDEQEIRDAFARTVHVRATGGEARDLADLWFFENLVRVHRAGEGEPYTGLKPAGYPVPAGIARADEALVEGSVDDLVRELADHVAQSLRERFDRVVELSEHPPADVAAGRARVRAYTEYMHYVEALHTLLTGEGESHWAGHR